jgi:hypothetical protein
MATGEIEQLSHGRFCGVIRAGDSQRIFFHGRDLESVTFELIADPISGPRATRVRVSSASKRRRC